MNTTMTTNRTVSNRRSPFLAQTGIIISAVILSLFLPIAAVAQTALVWTGAVDNNWNTSTQNWTSGPGGAEAAFANGNAVIFDETSTTGTIAIPGSVSPSLIVVDIDRTLTFAPAASAGLSGNMPLFKSGSGTLVFSSENTGFTGTTTIDGGVLQIFYSNTAYSMMNTGPVVFAGGTLATNSYSNVMQNFDRPFNVPAGQTGTVRTLRDFRFIGVNAGSGTLTIEVGGSRIELFRDSFINFEGELRIIGIGGQRWVRPMNATGGGATFGSDSLAKVALFLDSVYIDAQSTVASVSIGALAGTPTARIQARGAAGATTYLIGAKNIDTTFSGTLMNASETNFLALTKEGTGMFTLDGTNTYTGTTTVNVGALRITGALGATPVIVNAAGVFGGSGTVGGNVIFADGAKALADVDRLSGTFSGLEVTGAVTLGSTLKVGPFRPDAMLASGVHTYTVLHAAGGITGSPSITWDAPGSNVATANFTQTADTITVTIDAAAPAAPAINSSLAVSGTGLSTFTYTITAANGPLSFSATGLPPELSLDTETGVISGTLGFSINVVTHTIDITATNLGGSDTKTLVLRVEVADIDAPVITSPLAVTGTVGEPFNYRIVGTDVPHAFTADPLPADLTFNATTGVISGTIMGEGVSNINLTATNLVGTGSATLILDAWELPVITSATEATANVDRPFEYTVTASGRYTSITGSGFPAGLRGVWDEGLPKIVGIPEAKGTYNITITITNPAGSDTKVLVLTVDTLWPTITSAPYVAVKAGQPVSYQIVADKSPTRYDVTPLPAGLSIDTSTGLLTGTPTAAGTSVLTLSAENAEGVGTLEFKLVVYNPAPAGALLWTGAGDQVSGTATWDTTTLNWSKGGVPRAYSDGEDLYFDDSSDTTRIILTGTSAPKSITFDVSGRTLLLETSATAAFTGEGQVTVKGSGTVGFSGNTNIGSGWQGLLRMEAGVFELSRGGSYGPMVFFGGTLAYTNRAERGYIRNFITVPEGEYGLMDMRYAFRMQNTLVGSGTLEIRNDGQSGQYYYSGQPFVCSDFTGMLILSGSGIHQLPTSNSFDFAYGLRHLTLVLEGAVNMYPYTNSQGSTIYIGALAGGSPDAVLRGGQNGPAASANSTYRIGSKNLDTTFAGTIGDWQEDVSVRNLKAALYKEGTGMLTLTGSHNYTWPTTVASGALRFTKTARHMGSAAITVTGSQGAAFGGAGTIDPDITFEDGSVLLVDVDEDTGGLAGPNVSGRVTFDGSTLQVRPVVTGTGRLTNGVYTILFSENPFNGRPALSWAHSADPAIHAEFEYVKDNQIQVTITGGAIPKPVITSPNRADVLSGQPFTYTLTALGDSALPTTLEVANLPAGLTFDAATGVISGTVITTSATYEDFEISLGAGNVSGASTGILTLRVHGAAPPKPEIDSPLVFAAIRSRPMAYQITASNFPTRFTATGLPHGITVDANGLITGVSETVAEYTITITASNITGTDTKELRLIVSLPPPTMSTFSTVAEQFKPFTYQAEASNNPLGYAIGGFYEWSGTMSSNTVAVYTRGAAVTYLTIDPATGVISGTFPKVETNMNPSYPAARFAVTGTVFAWNNTGTGWAPMIIYVNPPAPVVQGASTFSGVVGVPFSGKVPATNMYFVNAYRSSYGVTNIPKGLSVDPRTGEISGEPLVGGNFEAAFVASNVSGANAKIVTFKINGASQLSTIAGEAGVPGDTDGPASSARFNSPGAGIVDKDGNLYVADTANNSIRKIAPEGTVRTFATGLNEPGSVVMNAAGTVLYVADTGSDSIKKIDVATGVVTTLVLAGMPALSAPHGLVIDAAGNLYVADTGNHLIRKIDPASGAMTTLAGTGASGSADGTGATAAFDLPMGLAINTGATRLYVADTGNHTIRVLDLATGNVTTLAGSAGVFGSADGIGAAARFNTPEGLALDSSGILYVADTGNHAIRSIDTTTGSVITFAGNPNESGSDDGNVAVSTLENPRGLTISPNGEIYVLDTGNHTIRVLQVGPAIVTAPADQRVPLNSTVAFTVVASGGPRPTYQWYKDDLIIAGATEATLTISNVQLADVARYRVVAANPLGLRSASAWLTIADASPNNPSDVGAGGGGGGGGGGAPSAWFLAALALVALLRGIFASRRGSAHSAFTLCLLASGLCLLPSPISAQAVRSTGNGTITGRVLNKATGQYLSDALVTVEGTGIQALTDSTGAYRLEGVPVGAVRLSARYTGLDDMSKDVTVSANTSARADFDLTAQIYQLEKFTVAGNREGSSRAVQEQRMSNTQKAIFAADSFGNIVDNNIGELMKNLPGITIDYDGEDASTMRIRGMDPELANITLDGNEVASIGGSESRAFNLKGAALQNIEKIEVNAAPTADQSASTMGGQVNIVTKSALSQKGRRLMFIANMSINTAELNFDKTAGGNRTPDRKLQPGFNFSWSDNFNQRFAFVFDVGFTRKYRYNNDYQLPNGYTYDTYVLAQNNNRVTPETPGFVKDLQWKESGGSSEDRMISLSLDYEPWGPNHSFFLKTSYNDTRGLGSYVRSMRVTAGDQANGSSLDTMISPIGASVSMNDAVRTDNNRTYSFNGGGKHKLGNLAFDYNAYYSQAKSDPKPEENYSISYSTRGLGMNIFNLSGNGTGQIVQTSNNGQGIVTAADPRSYLNLDNYNRLTLSQDVTTSKDERLGAKFNITLPVVLRVPFTSHDIPIEIKAGASYGEQSRHTHRYWRSRKLTGSDKEASYETPAEPVLRSFADPYSSNSWGFDVPIPTWVSPYLLMDYYNTHSNAFYFQDSHNDRGDVQTWEQMRKEKQTTESNTAGYVQFTTRLMPTLTMIAGLRYEAWESTSVVPEFLGKRNAADVDRYGAGGDRDSSVQRFVVGTDPGTGQPIYEDNPYWIGLEKYQGKTAKELLEMQTTELFTYRHNSHTYPGEYFPNIQFKWVPFRNLQVRTARTTNIGRPALNQVLAEKNYNFRDRKVDVGNPELKPSSSEKYDLAFEYYPGKDGMLTLSLFYQKVQDYIRPTTRGFEVVNEDSPKFEQIDGYNIVLLDDIDSTRNESSLGYWTETNFSNVGKGTNQGFEISYRQRLDFIHSRLRDFQLYGAFSYADPKMEQSRHQMRYPSTVTADTMEQYNNSPMIWETVPMPGIQKRSATLRLSYSGRKLSGSIGAFWVDKFARYIKTEPLEITNQNAYLRFDLSFTYKINSRWQASFDWRNMTDVGDDRKIFDRTGGYFTSGMVMNVGVRANF